MKNIYLFQPQYSNTFKGREHYWIPYSAGCIWAYASQFNDITSEFQLKDILFKRSKFQDVIDQLEDPAVCGFSCYVWNEQYNLELAKLIRKKWPNCIIMFGGAQTSSEYLKYDFIDTVMLAEGEQSFVNALRDIINGNPLPELYPKARMQELDSLPSPYILGLFDSIVESNPDALWDAVLETNRGCPFACTFCDWGGVTYSKVKKFNLDRVEQDIIWMATHRVGTVFIADANFGIFAERDAAIAELIKHHCENSFVDYVNITYTKNSNENVFKIAQKLHPLSKAVTLSMQSMNPDTLVAIKRNNLSSNNLQHLMALSEKFSVPTYTEIILGMPEETLETWKTGITDLLENGQHNQIDVFFAMLLKNSEMATPASRFKYNIRSVFSTDYMLYTNIEDDTEEPIKEIAELISSTKTMPTEDMVESYMYSWTIVNMHIMGYSQLLAKYCRYTKGISYRQFYDQMFQQLKIDDSLINEFNEMQQAVQELLTTGKVTTLPVMINHMAFYSYVPLYQKRNQCVELAVSVATQFGEVDKSIIDLQKKYVYDHDDKYPVTVNSSVDITTWEKCSATYQVSKRVPDDFIPDYFNLSLQRRRGFLKNQISKVDV